MEEGDLGRRVTGALGRFTRDLTSEAREGRLEPVRCRDEEVARVIDILLRHGKNNPALVGPAGVGKTAIAEGLAQRLVGGDVPLVLRTTRLLALDHVALMAGTAYRGQYEERIRALVHETSADPDVVLFIGAALGAFAFIGVVYPVVKLRGAPRGDQIDLGLEAPRAELPEVPFGVFLAPAAILVLVWGETLIAWYSSQFLGM